MQQVSDLDAFYGLLAELEGRIRGLRRFGDCHGRMQRPERGDYFFFRTRRAEAVTLIRNLLTSIRLTPEDDGLSIELVGDLAGILALGNADNRKPRRGSHGP